MVFPLLLLSYLSCSQWVVQSTNERERERVFISIYLSQTDDNLSGKFNPSSIASSPQIYPQPPPLPSTNLFFFFSCPVVLGTPPCFTLFCQQRTRPALNLPPHLLQLSVSHSLVPDRPKQFQLFSNPRANRTRTPSHVRVYSKDSSIHNQSTHRCVLAVPAAILQHRVHEYGHVTPTCHTPRVQSEPFGGKTTAAVISNQLTTTHGYKAFLFGLKRRPAG